ncbi:MAG: cyclic 2,3-diphosphoglycerate synthase [Chloroflexaceae bacterium]|jgi:predicted GTPase|nr:cyclic 2,3-diphosphoglycerate synthase [Chloroflexaceae bacterium]
MTPRHVLIMGAAGRDFHNFNTVFRNNPAYRVVGFTATQIPGIAKRSYPPTLAGSLYPKGIPIYPESELRHLIHELEVDEVVFAYSDVSFEYVMERASAVLAAGANFRLLGPNDTMLRASVPVIAVVATRTGCGKSQTARKVCRLLRDEGLRVVAVRHPMPYGDLQRQRVQRFGSLTDLRLANCTIEEMEEYEPHIAHGTIVYAGDDYGAILQAAEHEADVIVWDGGNNDMAFFKPDLTITVTDPHRAGDELNYYPGATNLLLANVVVINKVDSADPKDIATVRANIAHVNPTATVIEAASPPQVAQPTLIRGKRVLVIEDGPSVTHGGMPFGAGTTAARNFGAAEIVDPHPYAVGSIAETLRNFPHLGALLPAMGYSEAQQHELEESIRQVPCDSVVIGTPIDLRRVITIKQPSVRVTYDLVELTQPDLHEVLAGVLAATQR